MADGSMEIRIVLSATEAKEVIDGLSQYAREKFKVALDIQTPGSPGASASGGAGVSTFGGGTTMGDPSAWRNRDPIKEPRIGNVGVGSMSPAMQAAIAAQDPTTAAWLAQQAATRMTPAEVRKAEQLHQWGIRNIDYEQRQTRKAENEQWRNESYVDRRDLRDEISSRRERVRGENRQHRDESFDDKQRIAEEKAERRQRVADDNRQHRDESYVDRRDFADDKRSRREGVSAENRQHRDESYMDREALALERAAFKGDMSGRSPREKAALLESRMAGMDPHSVEFQQLRAQREGLNSQMGLNRTIIPNHMYMQMMFGAMDVAGQVSHMEAAKTKAMIAPGIIGSLQAQSEGITGGGGIISQIVKGAWDIGGLVSNMDSPAKLEATVQKEARRQEIFSRIQDIMVENKVSRLDRSAPPGTFKAAYAANEAEQFVKLDKNQRRIAEISEKWNLSQYNDPEVVASERNEMTAIVQANKEIDAARFAKDNLVGRHMESFIRKQATGVDIAMAAAWGDSSTSLGRSRLAGAQQDELDAREGDKPEVLAALRRRQSADMLEYNYASGQKDAATLAMQRAGIQSTVFQGLRRPYEAELAQIIGQGQAGMAAGDGPMGKFMAMGQMLASISTLGGSFIRNTSNMNLANNAESQALQQLMAGDPVSAIQTRQAERMRQELDNLPQGPARSLVEAGIRKRYADDTALQVKGVQDQRFLEKEAVSGRISAAEKMVQGKDKDSRVETVMNAGLLEAKAFELQNRPDMQSLSLRQTRTNLQLLQREMKIQQYTTGSAEEVASGTFGKGGSSTMPTSLEAQPIQEGLASVEKAIDKVKSAIDKLTADD